MSRGRHGDAAPQSGANRYRVSPWKLFSSGASGTDKERLCAIRTILQKIGTNTKPEG